MARDSAQARAELSRQPLDSDTLLKRQLKPLYRELGLEGTLKSFRHGMATLMDRRRVPDKIRENRMGHYDAVLTKKVYTHAVAEDDRRFAESVGREFWHLVGTSPETLESVEDGSYSFYGR